MNARRNYGVLAVLAGGVRREWAHVEAPRNRELERAALLMAAQQAQASGFLAFSGALVTLAVKREDRR